MSNYKKCNINLAKRQFIKDLKEDGDFIEYRTKAHNNGFGIVKAYDTSYIINKIYISSESLITLEHKKYKDL